MQQNARPDTAPYGLPKSRRRGPRFPRRWGGALFVFVVAVAAIIATAIGIWLSPDRNPPSIRQADYGPGPDLISTVADGGSPQVQFLARLSDLPVSPSLLMVDWQGFLWLPIFDTQTKLYRYRFEVGETTVYELPKVDGTSISAGLVGTPDGSLVLGGGFSVVVFDPETGKSSEYTLPLSEYPIGGSTEPPVITDVSAGPDGTVYISCMSTASITTFNPESGKFSELQVPESFGPVWRLQAMSYGTYVSNGIAIGSSEPKAALLRNNGEFVELDASASDFALLQDGSVIAPQLEGGVSVFTGESVREFGTAPDVPVTLIGADSLNQVWFVSPTDNSVYLLDFAGELRRYDLPFVPLPYSGCPPGGDCHVGPVGTQVNGISVSPDGDLYFSTNNRIGVVERQLPSVAD